MSKVVIKYGDVAVGAREDFAPTVTEQSPFSDVEQIMFDDTSTVKYGNPCESFSVPLDNQTSALTFDISKMNLGYWSEQISGENGVFAEPIVFTFVATNYYSSTGIMFDFDVANNVYANDLKIEWYRGDSLISEKRFYPDNARFVCLNKVELYNKMVVSVYSINMPKNRFRLNKIEYGYEVVFTGKELLNTKMMQQMDILSGSLPISTCGFTLSSESGVDYTFQEKQPIKIFFDGKIKMTAFIKSAKRKARKIWAIESEDFIGLMNDVPFVGGMYNGERASVLIQDIFDICKVDCDIDDALNEQYVYGYIPYTNCREALKQVLFAVGAVVNTSGTEVAKITYLPSEIKQKIGLSRIMTGQSFNQQSKYAGVEVVAHSYRATTDTKVAFDSETEGTGENIFVLFSEPLHSLTIVNGAIVDSGTNYAIINADENCVLTGRTYSHVTISKKRIYPYSSAANTDNVVSVRNATLINHLNIDKTLERCYNYYENNNTISAKIVEGKHELHSVFYGESLYGNAIYGNGETTEMIHKDDEVSLGDKISCATEYIGDQVGFVVKQVFGLNGNILVKDTELRCVN